MKELACMVGMIVVGLAMSSPSPSKIIKWTTRDGSVTTVTKFIGDDWDDVQYFDIQCRLFYRKYHDSQRWIHAVQYDPETGQVLDHTIQ